MKRLQVFVLLFVLLLTSSCAYAKNNADNTDNTSTPTVDLSNSNAPVVTPSTVNLNQQPDLNQMLHNYWDYSSDTNNVKIEYYDPDVKKAFPDNLNEQIDNFAAQVQGDFVPMIYEDENVPNGLIELVEKSLFDGNLDSLSLGSASFEINIDDFYNEYGQQLKASQQGDYDLFDSKDEFGQYVRHIYEYEVENITYYLLVVDSGGSARFVNNFIYKETVGELSLVDSWGSLDMNAKVIEYDNNLYFIEQSYNYYSKFVDTVYIYKLLPVRLENYVSIEFLPEAFTWENIYANGQSYTAAVTDYINSIQDDLMAKSPINDDIQVYIGDETENIGHDRQLRLKSVGGNETYYEIDFNNDGIPEYLEKHFWFPSNYTRLYLMNDTYRFSESRILSIDNNFNSEGMTLIQLWFKKIGDQVFTFRLFLNSGYNYSLNVTLIDKTYVTQVQSYIVVPKNKFVVNS